VATLADASLALLPFRLRDNLILGPVAGPVELLLNRLPPVLLVLAAEDIDLDAAPEEGPIAERTAAADHLEAATERMHQAEQALSAVQADADELQSRLRQAAADTDADTVKGLIAKLQTARAAAARASRRASKARTRLLKAREQATALGAVPDAETDPSIENGGTDRS
jgi:hypothetical protein